MERAIRRSDLLQQGKVWQLSYKKVKECNILKRIVDDESWKMVIYRHLSNRLKMQKCVYMPIKK